MLNSKNDSFYTSSSFQDFFKTSCQSLILKADLPFFTILAVSDNYLKLTHKTRDEVLNRGLFEVYPGNRADLSEQFSVFSSFKKVLELRQADVLPTFKYEIYLPELGEMSTQYWSNLNEPLLDAEGNVAYLINTTANVTSQILNNRELSEVKKLQKDFNNEQELNVELLASNENLAQDNAQLGIEQKILQDLIAKLTESEAKVEQAELTMRLAIEAANVGTWYMDCESGTFQASTRLKELFGLYPENTLTLSYFIAQIDSSHREQIEITIKKAVTTVGPYDETYPINGFDNKTRWVRVLGNTSVQHDDCLAFTGVVINITELKEDELRKNDFISMVSHELKTPLTSIAGYGQLLNSRAKKNEDVFMTGTLGKMNIQIKKMTDMINGFLDKGHLESGKIQLHFKAFNIADLVNELIDEIRLTVITHIVNVGHCDEVHVFADRNKIGNVISNLLSNAIKYSPKGRYIEVNCAIIANQVQVSVKDEGIGITPSEIEKLFERYHRVKTEQTENISGFGIGLYLCVEIIKRHQGRIWVESKPGTGSTFYFNLPLSA
ncbi:MAG: PAS domain S-box protein [Sphingobacteriaceae bacterium]|nr:MAG: PAS domain S-box protein [Sphingobacteriaceae bacterium]